MLMPFSKGIWILLVMVEMLWCIAGLYPPVIDLALDEAGRTDPLPYDNILHIPLFQVFGDDGIKGNANNDSILDGLPDLVPWSNTPGPAPLGNNHLHPEPPQATVHPQSVPGKGCYNLHPNCTCDITHWYGDDIKINEESFLPGWDSRSVESSRGGRDPHFSQHKHDSP